MELIFIAGCGPGGAEFITPAVRAAVANATFLVGAQRLLAEFPECVAARFVVRSDMEAVLKTIEAHRAEGGRVVVLVTGDPGLCSLARPVLRHFGRTACRVIPGISSVHAAFAAVGVDWLDARILTAHDGVPKTTSKSLLEEEKLAVLAGNPVSADWIEELVTTLAPTHEIYLCENLTLPEESVRQVESVRFAEMASRCVLVLLKKIGNLRIARKMEDS